MTAATPLRVAERTLGRDDWTPVLDAELEALLAVETMVREALDADLPLADVFVRAAKSHLAALDEERRG